MFNLFSSSLLAGRRRLRQRQRLRFAQLLGLIIIAIFINTFLYTFGLMLDLKAHSRFKLDSITQQVFQSELIVNREKPIEIIVAIRYNHPQLTHLKLLLRSYKKLNPDILNITWIDPIKEPNHALQVQTKYGIDFHDDLMIIDAQTSNDGNAAKSKHVRIFSIKDLMVYTTDSAKNRILPTAYREEDMITSQLMGALEGTPKTLLFLKDKSTSDVKIQQTLEVLKTRLETENIKWITGFIQDLPALNYDVDAVLLISPEADFSNAELDILQTYWNKSYSSILVTLNPRYPLSRFKSFLRDQGIRARSDILVNGNAANQVDAFFVNEDVHSPAFKGIASTFRGLSGSLDVYHNNPKLQLKQLYPQPLIQANQGYWGETKLPIANASFDVGEDYAENLYLAAKVERRYEINNEELSSYLFVFSTADFMAVNQLSLEQGHYLLSVINEMVNRYELIGISQTPLVVSQLDLSQTQLDIIHFTWLIIFPVGILLVGFIVWLTRRR